MVCTFCPKQSSPADSPPHVCMHVCMYVCSWKQFQQHLWAEANSSVMFAGPLWLASCQYNKSTRSESGVENGFFKSYFWRTLFSLVLCYGPSYRSRRVVEMRPQGYIATLNEEGCSGDVAALYSPSTTGIASDEMLIRVKQLIFF